VSRILICTMFMAVLSGGLVKGPAAVTSLPTRPDHATPTDQANQTSLVTPAGLVARARPGDGDVGNKPALRFGWPLPGSPTVVRAFHPPAFRYGPGHRGVDLAAVAGTPVLAAGAGTVAFAGIVAGHGVVSVEHPGGLRTTYEPVSPTVTAGDRVTRGEQIGTVQPGHLGCPVTACLHWGVLYWGVLRGPAQDRQYLDPLRLLAAARVRLLPIDGQPVTPVPR
jgi:murein DD-endopeptidase MepM/ murein hydrolase activator NlpD